MFTPSERFVFALLLTAVCVVLGGVYLYTLLPGTGYSGDTAKLQFIGHVLGTPHEPGMPTYVLLNAAWVRAIPLGSIAQRANALSALFSVLTASVIMLTLHRSSVRAGIAAVCALTFGLGYTVWSQSVIAEVYALHGLFVASVLYMILRWRQSGNVRFFDAAILLYALSFGNHLTSVTMLPALIYIVWKTDRRMFTHGRTIVRVLFFIAIGASQYAYIFIRSHDSSTPYLEMAARDISTFWGLVTGGQFQHLLVRFSLEWILTERVPVLALFAGRELLLFIPFIALGIWAARKSVVGIFLLFIAGANLLFAIGYAIQDFFPYLIPSYVVFAWFSGTGAERLLADHRRGVRILAAGVLCCAPIVAFGLNYREASQRTETLADEHVRSALTNIDSNCIIIVPNYHYAMMMLYQTLAGERQHRDIDVVFYHERENYTADAMSYLFGRHPWKIPVTQRTVGPGKPVYVLTRVYEWDVDRWLTYTKPTEAVRERWQEEELRPWRGAEETAGIRLARVGEYLYRVDARRE
ncbi:MAG: DUF2723 domain-containing protein [Bacteroidetes bacterium]|nr:DUF2723 domain-containing protein [Bacteroidota bacterium]